jgi:hypothetical protein
MMQLMNPYRTFAVSILASLAVASCGGSDAATATTKPSSKAAAVSTTQAPAVAVTLLGEPSRIEAGAHGAVQMTAAPNGRNCGMSKDLFGSCRAGTGAGGVFTVTFENDREDFTWNVVVRCGLNPTQPIAAAQKQELTLSADLDFDGVGEVVGVIMKTDGVSEAALVYQPKGVECPQVFGLGQLKLNTAMGGGHNVVTITRPDGTTACISEKNAEFTVTPAVGIKCA